jgi:hypothetical protein
MAIGKTSTGAVDARQCAKDIFTWVGAQLTSYGEEKAIQEITAYGDKRVAEATAGLSARIEGYKYHIGIIGKHFNRFVRLAEDGGNRSRFPAPQAHYSRN